MFDYIASELVQYYRGYCGLPVSTFNFDVAGISGSLGRWIHTAQGSHYPNQVSPVVMDSSAEEEESRTWISPRQGVYW